MQNTVKIDQEKLNKVMAMDLRRGTGRSMDEQLCIMQAVDYVTSGGFSDHPICACPALTRFAIRLNDRFDHEHRQLLKPLIPKLVGTRDKKTKERAHALVLHSITKTFPLLVEALGLKDEAAKLRTFKMGEWQEMREYCTNLRAHMKKAAADAAADAANAAAANAAANAAAAYAAAADAAADADAAAAAANAARKSFSLEKKEYWTGVKVAIWKSQIENLAAACEIKE